MAYASIEPFGEEAANVRAGIIASTIANRHRDPKREPKAYTTQDFMPFADRPDPAAALTEQIKRAFPKPPKKKGRA